MTGKVILITGPTASGKSMLALDYAKRTNGVIINVDAMQVYAVLNVLTSRPQMSDFGVADHQLYGFVAPATRYSTGAWLKAVSRILNEKKLGDRTMIFVGGTGLYFQALLNGISSVPHIAQEIVDAVSAEILPLDRLQRIEVLRREDPQMGEVLREPDRQRVIRALSVLRATGRSLADWQNEPHKGLLEGFDTEKIVLNPDRQVLASRISHRSELMLKNGALEEVQKLLDLKLDVTLPVMKAIGVREIGTFFRGNYLHQEMVEHMIIATRQYAKRQRTWFRKHMADWEWRTD